MKIFCDNECLKRAVVFYMPHQIIKYYIGCANIGCVARCLEHLIHDPEPFWKQISEEEYMVARVMES